MHRATLRTGRRSRPLAAAQISVASACQVAGPSSSNAATTAGVELRPGAAADLRGGVLDRPLLLVRPLVDEDVEDVGDRDQRGRRSGSRRRPARPGSRRRPSARGGSGRSARRGRHQRRARRPSASRAPTAAWVLTTSNSSSVSLSGLSRIESGIAILPMSCSGAARRMSSTSRPSAARAGGPGARRARPTRCVCSQVLSSRYSAASDEPAQSASSRRGLGVAAGARAPGRRARPRARARASRSAVTLERSREAVEHPRRRRPPDRAVVERRRRAARCRGRAGRAARAAPSRARAGRRSRRAARVGRAGDRLLDVGRELDRGGARGGEPAAQARAAAAASGPATSTQAPRSAGLGAASCPYRVAPSWRTPDRPPDPRRRSSPGYRIE